LRHVKILTFFPVPRGAGLPTPRAARTVVGTGNLIRHRRREGTGYLGQHRHVDAHGDYRGSRLYRRTRGNPPTPAAGPQPRSDNQLCRNQAYGSKQDVEKGGARGLGLGGVRPRAPMADGGHSAVARYLGSAGERFNSRRIARLPAPRCESFQFVFINLTFRTVRQNFEIATVVSSFLRTGSRGKASLDPSG